MTDPLVTSEHLREARRRYGGYCTRGMDAWGERYGLSLRVFLQEGYPASVFEATGDLFGIRLAAIAREGN